MEWDADARQLYDIVAKKIPFPVKLIAIPAICRAAEKHAEKHLRESVGQSDLVVGIFEVVPQSFRAQVVANLMSHGVDCKPFLNVADPTAEKKNDLKRLVDSLRSIAQLTEVTLDEAKTKGALEAYSDYFRNSPISISVTTRPQENRNVFVRYMETMKAHTPDPVTMARLNGFLPEEKTPLLNMYQEVKSRFNALGYGVDVNIGHGLSSLWAILTPVPIEEVMELTHLPLGARKNLHFLQKYGLNRFSIIGFNFAQQVVNLYVLIREPNCVSLDKYDDLLADLEFVTVSPEVLAQCARANVIHFTFSFRRDVVERVCFTSVYTSRDAVPVHLHPLLRKCVAEPVFSNGHDKFIVGTSVSANDFYFKIENDYNNCMVNEMQKASLAGV